MSSVSTSHSVTDGEVDAAQGIAVREQALDLIEERRLWPRKALPVLASLRTLAGVDIPVCPADNISDGGLRLTVPVGFGLAVGQRHEVQLCQPDTEGESCNLVGEGHYATVVRTEIMLGGEGKEDRVGVSLCFDTPIVM